MPYEQTIRMPPVKWPDFGQVLTPDGKFIALQQPQAVGNLKPESNPRGLQLARWQISQMRWEMS